MKNRKPSQQGGFTLVELAIVLVIIGLILGMAFKGKDLIDSAKVKSLAAQYYKVIAATNIYYEKYGSYPGDGCLTATPVNAVACNGPKDGSLQGAAEPAAFWYQLINNTGILTSAERHSVFGQDWNIWHGSPYAQPADFLDLPGGPQIDNRLLCALDQMIDDGNAGTGAILATPNAYNATTDCWNPPGGQTQIDGWLKILP